MVFELGNRLGGGGYGSVYDLMPNSQIEQKKPMVMKIFKSETANSSHNHCFYDHPSNVICTLDFLYQLKASHKTFKHILFPTHFVTLKKLVHVTPDASFDYLSCNKFKYAFVMPKMAYMLGQLGNTQNIKKHDIEYNIYNCQEWLHQLTTTIKNINELYFSHCDITPNNIMFDENNMIYLIDYDLVTWYGIKKIIGHRRVTQAPTRPPEGFFGCILNESSDMFSLGVIFTNLLFKCQIFPFRSNSQEQAVFLFNNIPLLDFSHWHQSKDEVDYVKYEYNKFIQSLPLTKSEFYHSIIKFITLFETKTKQKVLVTQDHIEMLPLLDQMTEPNAYKRCCANVLVDQLTPIVERNKSKIFPINYTTDITPNDPTTVNYCVPNEIVNLNEFYSTIPEHFEYYYEGPMKYKSERTAINWWMLQYCDHFGFSLETSFVCVECLDILLEKSAVEITMTEAEYIAMAIVHIVTIILHHAEHHVVYEDLIKKTIGTPNVIMAHVLTWKRHIISSLMGEFRCPIKHGIEYLASQLTDDTNILNIILVAILNEDLMIYHKNNYEKIINVTMQYLFNYSDYTNDVAKSDDMKSFYDKVKTVYLTEIYKLSKGEL